MAERRVPVPSPAERAKTIARRGGQAALYPVGEGTERVVPYLHHVADDGHAVLLLPAGHPLFDRPNTLLLELSDPTPVRLREPVRALLWITGVFTPADDERAEVLAVAERRSDPRLLDAGHEMRVGVLRPIAMVLADSDGTSSLRLADFASAEADPFTHNEQQWLQHLELAHVDVVGVLSRHLPDELRGGHVRPLGLDRCGIRLRVEMSTGDHDVRLAFAHPVCCPADLAKELRRLLGCPFLAAQRH